MSNYSQPTLLLLGRNGQVGWELVRTLAPLGRLIAPDRAQLDISSLGDLSGYIREVKPSIIINAAAYTAVDLAEQEENAAFLVNATVPGVLGEEARKCGAAVIHYSTDYVFDGSQNSPYRENALTDPVNAYGRTKLEGEKALVESGAASIIFRTSWVYGLRGRNFLLTMLRLARERDRLTVVNDQIGAPTWSRLIAEATAQVIAQRGRAIQEVQGIYHLTCQGETTWYEFACHIVACDDSGKLTEVVPITTDQYPTLARRPCYSVLNTDKLAETFGIRLPHWQDALHMVLEQNKY